MPQHQHLLSLPQVLSKCFFVCLCLSFRICYLYSHAFWYLRQHSSISSSAGLHSNLEASRRDGKERSLERLYESRQSSEWIDVGEGNLKFSFKGMKCRSSYIYLMFNRMPNDETKQHQKMRWKRRRSFIASANSNINMRCVVNSEEFIENRLSEGVGGKEEERPWLSFFREERSMEPLKDHQRTT